MNLKKEFKTALVLGTEGLVMAGAGSSLSITGINVARPARTSLGELLAGLKNALFAAKTREKEVSEQEEITYVPEMKEYATGFNTDIKLLLESVRLV